MRDTRSLFILLRQQTKNIEEMLRVSKMINCKRQFTHSARLLRLTIDPIPAMQVKPVKINYVRPIVFGLATSASIFFTAAFIHEKEKETFWQRLKKRSEGPKWSTIRDVITDDKLILADLCEEKKKMWLEKKQAVMEDLKKKLEQYQSVPIEIKRAFLAGAQAYLSMSEAEKTVAALIGLNLLVFGAWKVRGLQPFMTRYFMHNPGSGRSITLITSCFSHRDLIHLTFNMVGLWSFGPLIHDVLGREQFVAMYLSMGIGANVISHVTSLALRHTRPMAPSLGTSGSLYGLLTSTALIFPNSSVFIVFLPIIPIRIRYRYH